jgi:hypothetical protein
LRAIKTNKKIGANKNYTIVATQKRAHNSHMDAKIDFSSKNIIVQFLRHAAKRCFHCRPAPKANKPRAKRKKEEYRHLSEYYANRAKEYE